LPSRVTRAPLTLPTRSSRNFLAAAFAASSSRTSSCACSLSSGAGGLLPPLSFEDFLFAGFTFSFDLSARAFFSPLGSFLDLSGDFSGGVPSFVLARGSGGSF
ncbi:hypothetical protein CSUI_007110, partial [Cystoisospora suis]